jgi:hypothetical protein
MAGATVTNPAGDLRIGRRAARNLVGLVVPRADVTSGFAAMKASARSSQLAMRRLPVHAPGPTAEPSHA